MRTFSSKAEPDTAGAKPERPRSRGSLEEAGAAVAPFVVGAALGSGGSAHVFRGVDAAGRPVALKTLKPELDRHPHAARLLEHEARMLARVRHAHVVACHGIVRLRDGRPALALEYLDGGDLVSLAGAAPRSWIGAALGIARALAHCHACGVVHGDVKARNVLFSTGDRPRLIDFAAARSGGGPAASPEVDVRAFAALLYELLGGAPPGPGAIELPAAAAAAGGTAGRRIAHAVTDVLAGRRPARLFALADVLESARCAERIP